MTYDELVTNIRNYSEVGNNVFTASVINNFITFAENRILRDIDLDVFKAEFSGNLVQNNKFLAAPNNILTHRYITITVNNEKIPLDFRDSSFLTEYWPNATLTGVPKFYSVWDQSTFYLAPTPNAAFAVDVAYIYRPTQLSSTNTTTWISTNAPEALFYACMIQAYSYTKGPADMMQYFQGAYQQAIQGLGIEQQGRRRRDEYSDGMIRIPIRSDSPA